LSRTAPSSTASTNSSHDDWRALDCRYGHALLECCHPRVLLVRDIVNSDKPHLPPACNGAGSGVHDYFPFCNYLSKQKSGRAKRVGWSRRRSSSSASSSKQVAPPAIFFQRKQKDFIISHHIDLYTPTTAHTVLMLCLFF
jgi:hypothetical protein